MTAGKRRKSDSVKKYLYEIFGSLRTYQSHIHDEFKEIR